MKDEDGLEVLEILDGEEIQGGKEIFVGIFGGAGVDVDDGVVLVGAGDEINQIEDDFLDGVGLSGPDDDVEAVVAGVVQLGAEGGVGFDEDDHFVGRFL